MPAPVYNKIVAVTYEIASLSQVSPSAPNSTKSGAINALGDYVNVTVAFDGVYNDVFYRCRNAGGTPIDSAPILVNTETQDYQGNPSVAALANGGFVVTWESYRQVTGSWDTDVFQQAYDANGNKVGFQKLVNTTTAASQFDPSIAALANGGWVVIWTSVGQDNVDNSQGIYQQAYNADGTPNGGAMLVNVTTDGDQTDSFVTAHPDGSWTVHWADYYNQKYMERTSAPPTMMLW